ncbi:hypothetical protein PR048_003771 [Dryococelus australis]|uniref:Uncharacterized protein n=1 Tax=Dryococelus australis TaxID=614101 RepID=A0ABQ9INY9_9NEOP|nr:hypothetical protein PR048_003771 [Dryococelus australis]
MASQSECLVCRKTLEPGQEEVTTVKRGLLGHVNASEQRADGNVPFLRYLVASGSSLKLHERCRKYYTRPSTINKHFSSEKKSEDPDLGTERRLRSSVDVFNIEQDCLYCEEEASVRKETKKEVKFRKTTYEVTILPFKDSVIARALAWVEIVHARALSVADLEVAEAKYHKQCRLLFVSMAIRKSSIVNLKGFASSILHDKLYLDKKDTKEEEIIRIVEAAANITRRDIRSLLYYGILNRYEFSALEHRRASTGGSKKVYIQYAFDNADFNIRTITGHGTFHTIGGVRFITSTQNQESMTVNRLLHPSSADTIAARGKLQVNCYKKKALSGLKGINICELATVSDATDRSGSCIVTFDQPLYAKASEIIAVALPGELDIASLRLGGFHLRVSFMGSIGFIMPGSHAFSRVVRTQMITSQALITMILEMENLFGVYQEELHKFFLEVSIGENMIPDAVELPVLVSCLASFERKSSTMHLFIRAEMSGDWELHLKCVCSMLPRLHAVGHIHYAKSANLYVQQMKELPSRMPPHEYNKFTSEVFLTARRKNEFWGGVWTDLSIEKAWNHRKYTCISRSCFSCMPEVVQCLEEFSCIKAGSSEQHVELRDSRRTRDAHDVAVLLSWLKEHSPWDVDCLRSLASGDVGDDSINCDQAEYVGLGAIERIIGSNVGEVKLM